MFTASTPSPADWDSFVDAHPRGHVLQRAAWGDLKAGFGWSVERAALVDAQGRIAAGAQILFRALPAGLGSMAYIPFGPLASDDAQYAALWPVIRRAAARHRAAFLKIEPGFAPLPDFTRWGFRPSPQTIQPPNTILIDITGDDETILARMNQGTRRKVRTPEKKDVRVIQAARADLPKFTAMLHTTGERKAFGVHAPEYYERAFDLFVPDHAALFIAEHEGDALAGIFAFATGSLALYLYGASSDVKRNLNGSYGAHWAAIQWARARGCTHYDLWGIPDENEAALEAGFADRSDGLWGVYGSKRGWGGEVRRTVGAFDLPLNPLLYAAYRLYLRLRSRPGGD
jgi:lipid II:glycine glycyltransferase (peptidoglycan interpeptide bridge formation enzyme)